MTGEHSPSVWLRQLRGGDDRAARRLWEAYYCKLVALARRKLEGRMRLVGDEEDVALSAFKSFCRGVENGRFPDLNDRDDLWRLLVTITLHKVLRLVRDETRQRRGGNLRAVSSMRVNGASDALDQLIGNEPTPELAAQLAEQCQAMLKQLPSSELVELAIFKMEGYTNAEIAARWGKAERTVERKLRLIRHAWSQHVDQQTQETTSDGQSLRLP